MITYFVRQFLEGGMIALAGALPSRVARDGDLPYEAGER
jgi:hypothetical protein